MALAVNQHFSLEMKSEIEIVKKEFTKKIIEKEVEIQNIKIDFAGKLQKKDLQIQQLTEKFDGQLQEKDKQIQHLRNEFDYRLQEKDDKIQQLTEKFDCQLRERDDKIQQLTEKFDDQMQERKIVLQHEFEKSDKESIKTSEDKMLKKLTETDKKINGFMNLVATGDHEKNTYFIKELNRKLVQDKKLTLDVVATPKINKIGISFGGFFFYQGNPVSRKSKFVMIQTVRQVWNFFQSGPVFQEISKRSVLQTPLKG